MVYLLEVFSLITCFSLQLNHFISPDWALIRRVFIRAREVFGIPNKDINMTKPDLQMIEVNFNRSKQFLLKPFSRINYSISMIYVQHMHLNYVNGVVVHITFENVVQNLRHYRMKSDGIDE